jgi:hypothetical protein
VTVSWAKSRPGRVEPFALRINHRTATVSAVEAPTKGDDPSAEARHNELLQIVADLVRRHPGIPGARAAASRLGRRRSDVLIAIAELLELGTIENRGNPRHPRLFMTPSSVESQN